MQLLIQFCSGKLRKIIESCIRLEPKKVYLKAKRMLIELFADIFDVSKSWIDKVSKEPVIKPNDRGALQDLADDLKSCEIMLKATGRIMQINNEDRLVKILERCPGFVKSRWRSRTQEIRAERREPIVQNGKRFVRTVALKKK